MENKNSNFNELLDKMENIYETVYTVKVDKHTYDMLKKYKSTHTNEELYKFLLFRLKMLRAEDYITSQQYRTCKGQIRRYYDKNYCMEYGINFIKKVERNNNPVYMQYQQSIDGFINEVIYKLPEYREIVLEQ